MDEAPDSPATTAAPAAAPASPPASRAARATRALSWGALALTLTAAALVWLAGDRWWPATLLTFGPRWVVLAPLPALALAALCVRRSALLPLALAGLIGLGPVMGFRLPVRTWLDRAPPTAGSTLRVLSYNCGGAGGRGRREALDSFLREHAPDLVALAEWPSELPIPAAWGDGWHVGRYGGLLVASRFPIIEQERLRSARLERWNNPALRCAVQTPDGVVQLVAVHLETPRDGLEAVLSTGWRGAAAMERTTAIRDVESQLASELAARAPGPTIIAGDFNMPADSAIYRRHWRRWQNAFSVAGTGFGYTKGTRYFSARIDHVLAGPEFRVLSAAAGPPLGGDHRPVLAELSLVAPAAAP